MSIELLLYHMSEQDIRTCLDWLDQTIDTEKGTSDPFAIQALRDSIAHHLAMVRLGLEEAQPEDTGRFNGSSPWERGEKKN